MPSRIRFSLQEWNIDLSESSLKTANACLQKTFRRDVDAAFALDRLDEYRRGLRSYEALRGLQVPVRHGVPHERDPVPRSDHQPADEPAGLALASSGPRRAHGDLNAALVLSLR